MSLFSLDIETTGLDRFKDKILVIGVYNPKEGYYHFKTVEEFKQWHKLDYQYIMHGGSFDVNFLYGNGVDVSNNFYYDTRSISSILIPPPVQAPGQKHALGLENLYVTLLHGESYKLDRTDMSSYAYSELIEYNKKDCIITYDLFEYLLKNIPAKHWEFVESWIMPATRLCAGLEYNGIYGDWEGLKEYGKELTTIRDKVLQELNQLTKLPREYKKQLEEKELKEIYEQKKITALSKSKNPEKRAKYYKELLEKAKAKIEEFNWSSPQQVVWLFKDYYGLDLVNKRTEKETTDDEKLKELDHPVAKKLLEYREVEKLLTQQIPGLLDNVKEDGCIHGRFTVGGTRTGRLSSSQPNLQQISSRKPIGRKIRSFIQSTKGNQLVTIDYAQIEPRILAYYSKEPELVNAFKENIDIYSVFAKEIFQLQNIDLKTFKQNYPIERACGKTGGLSCLYGTGGRKFAEMVRKETGKIIPEKEAKRLVTQFRESLPLVTEFKNKLEMALMNRRPYFNLLGRPFIIESFDDLYMKSLNTLIQGSASDLVVFSQFGLVFPELKKRKIPFIHRLLIHDESVIELPASEASWITKEIIEPLMTKGVMERLGIDVPLKVEYTISDRWEKA